MATIARDVPLEIRSATADDREAICRVARETWHDTDVDLDPAAIVETVDAWYDDDPFVSTIEEPGTAVVVAERDGEVVGFAHGVVAEDEGNVLRMYVHPNHQREGVGTALHERLRTALEDFSMERMRAIDLASNEGGRRFYEALGFERTGEGEVVIGDEAHEEVVYALEL